ncbi:hypothetical protein ASH00_16140 [Arthrobacter sp. Soil782]|uniref:RES family NAD+ phosphorylase n=1 Tax=Arthrobacter sp. Soil782 TaxID=1736410 RepID=UPI0006F4A4B2|nr:RES family NAD+ phosphorylase [Arthrobacter sp. Soil782]KRF07074.1 hypothetical protein ASH00_16140 [Arthrobacter sp. Soil782]
MVTGPKGAFEPLSFTLTAGEQLYRVFSNRSGRPANAFNPGAGRRTRFAFFGDPKVPVLYAAQTEEAAVCETLLHDVPIDGGMLNHDDYGDKVMARLIAGRDLNLASFMGTGLRALKVEETDVTATPASSYGETVAWAEAAHAAGFDGIVWMSHRCNTDRAFVFFGDRVTDADLEIDIRFARVFELDPDRAWLSDFCAPLHVDVRW